MVTTKNAIEVTNLVKRYKELVALDHFNLTVKTGEIFGVLGPNGSGKTTTINSTPSRKTSTSSLTLSCATDRIFWI